jgi:inosose dehydratase
VLEVLERYTATSARPLVLSADSGPAGYDTRPTLDEHGWATLLANLDRIDAVAAEHNVRAVLPPHVGTMIENGVARQVQPGRRNYTEAVCDGIYRPLGSGDVDVAAIVGHLRRQGYDGWYILEQDTILTEEPRGEGPVADVYTSAEYLRSVISSSG